MKKKGFTLIELLAVIVILAIIALIATPIVMNTIENSKKGAAERSAENYMNAVETAVAEERIDGVVLEGEYTIQDDGSLCPVSGCGEADKDKVLIEMSGNKPSSGTIKIANGLVTTESTMSFADNYTVSYDSTKGSYVATKEESGGNTTTTVYRWSTEEVNIGAELSSFTYVENLSDLSKDHYLKHVLDKDNKVVESWVCVKDGVVEKACVRGGVDENGNYYANNLILEDLNNKGLCVEYDEMHSYCGLGSVGFTVVSTPSVSSSDGSCMIGLDGSSMCEIR